MSENKEEFERNINDSNNSKEETILDNMQSEKDDVSEVNSNIDNSGFTNLNEEKNRDSVSFNSTNTVIDRENTADIRANDIFERRNKNKKNKSFGFKGVLTVFVVLLVIVSIIQSLYIFTLTMPDSNISKSIIGLLDKNYGNKVDGENKKEKSVNSATNPNFSLEDAAKAESDDKEAMSIVNIAKKVMPATVSVYVTAKGTAEPSSSGSGFIISSDGYIITNNHVIESVVTSNMNEAKVQLYGQTDIYDAKIVGHDAQTDIAVLKIDGNEDFPCATLGDSDALQVGELAVAIGNPLGDFEGSVTAGIISGTEREVDLGNGYQMNLLQTDAAINGGNSGGPLINSFGEVIGITNIKYKQVYNIEGMGFAIPVNSIKSVVETLIQNGYVKGRPTLGIVVEEIHGNEYFGVRPGVYVVSCTEGGAAAEAGIQKGDRIIEFDGEEITTSAQIIKIRDKHEVGDVLTVKVECNEKIETFKLEVGDSELS